MSQLREEYAEIECSDTDNDPDYDPLQNMNAKRRKCVPDYFGLRTKSPKAPSCLRKSPSPSTSSSSSQLSSATFPESESPGPADNVIKNSALFDGTYFTVHSSDSKNITAKCKLCEPNQTLIKGVRNATSNFLKHLKTKHNNQDAFAKYQGYKLQKKSEMKSPYIQKLVQSKLEDSPTLRAKKTMIRVNEETFNEKLIKFVADTMCPLSIIERESFKALFEGLDIKIMTRKTLTNKINATTEKK